MTEARNIRAISRLYELLSEFTEAEFKAAASAKGLSSLVRSALENLAMTRSELGPGAKSGDASPDYPSPVRPKKSAKVSGLGGGDKLTALMTRILSDRHLLKSTAERTDLFKTLGLPFKVAPKDSRTRILGRFKTATKNMSPSERDRVYVMLRRLVESRQTAGWFSVIRGPK